MNINKLISVLRNPYGIEEHIINDARLAAANLIEDLIPIKIKTPQDYLSEITRSDFQDSPTTNHATTNHAPKNHIQEAKPDMSELPLDLLSELLCPAYQEGTIKYYRNSWRLGFKLSIMMAACLRHLTKFYFFNEDYDKETLATYKIKKHHLGAAIFCIIAMYNDWKNHPDNDDRPNKKDKQNENN